MSDLGKISVTNEGDWNASTPYEINTIVRHNGATYMSLKDSTGQEPSEENTEYWSLISKDGTTPTVDSELSDTSINPVQNKVVKANIDTLQGEINKNKLNIAFADHDTATSGTSFTDAEDGNMLVTDWTKNLLNPTLQTTTKNGVTCTNNGDGTYTLNGTASLQTTFIFAQLKASNLFKNGITYKFCGCPKLNNNIWLIIEKNENPFTAYVTDYGNGETFTYTLNDDTINIFVRINEGIVLNNVVLKPMITTDLSATYDDFVPYGGYEIQSCCGKNLFNPTLETTTQNGITCTNNGDGTYTLNGKVIDRRLILFNIGTYTLEKNKTYKFIGMPDLGLGLKCYVDAREDNGDQIQDIGSGKIYTSKNGQTGRSMRIIVDGESYSDIVLNNILIKPMITTDLTATYDDFEPYTGETITVTNTTEAPAFGLKSHKGITNIISPGNVKCVYPTNESGKGVLDAMYNNSQLSNEVSKLKNAIIAMGGTV